MNRLYITTSQPELSKHRKKQIVISTVAKRSGEISKSGAERRKTEILRQAQDDFAFMYSFQGHHHPSALEKLSTPQDDVIVI